MKYVKKTSVLLVAILLALTACGNKETETADTTESVTVLSAEESSQDTSDSSEDSSYEYETAVKKKYADEDKINQIKSNAQNNKAQTAIAETKTTEEEKKTFNLSGQGINIYLTSDWTYHDAEAAYTEFIDETPAVIMYKTNVDNCTVMVADGSETEEAFAQNTEESYVEAYGSQYESIDVTSFESVEIDGVASFKILADIKISGKDVKMMHIISNSTVKNKTISIMLLDTDGEILGLFDNFEEDNVYYSETLSVDFRIGNDDNVNSVKDNIREKTRRQN